MKFVIMRVQDCSHPNIDFVYNWAKTGHSYTNDVGLAATWEDPAEAHKHKKERELGPFHYVVSVVVIPSERLEL